MDTTMSLGVESHMKIIKLRIRLILIKSAINDKISSTVPIFLGIVASMFFASTFILNRSMHLGGGSWIWSSSLRYLITLPMLLVLVSVRGNLLPLLMHMKKHLFTRLVRSTVGFGIAYSMLCLGADYGPGWLVASTWQVTIMAGSLMTPLFFEKVNGFKRRKTISLKGMENSVIIIIGILLLQLNNASGVSTKELVLGIVPVIIAAFAFPLGNRKMMEFLDGKMDVYQRVLGMTLASIPFWLFVSMCGVVTVGLPSFNQIAGSSVVALFSGIIATLCFFKGTDMVCNNDYKLAKVEATQSVEVLFVVLGEILLLGGNLPSKLSIIGMILVTFGIILHSLRR